jgi:hypothetical protein
MASNYAPPTRRENASTASILNILCGIWLIISPFILGYYDVTAAIWNSIVLGVVVLILAAARVSNPNGNVGLSWINLLLGIWLIISPFFMYPSFPTPIWNNVILGILVAIFAIWSAVSTTTYGPPATTSGGPMPPTQRY